MKILIFDTETTGLAPKETSLYQTNSWPHVVQFSFIMFNSVSNKIEMNHDYIIKIPKEKGSFFSSYPIKRIEPSKIRYTPAGKDLRSFKGCPGFRSTEESLSLINFSSSSVRFIKIFRN